jgi:hypothetical protein
MFILESPKVLHFICKANVSLVKTNVFVKNYYNCVKERQGSTRLKDGFCLVKNKVEHYS